MKLVENSKCKMVIRVKKDLFVYQTLDGAWYKQTPDFRKIGYGSIVSLLDKNVQLKKKLEILGLVYGID